MLGTQVVLALAALALSGATVLAIYAVRRHARMLRLLAEAKQRLDDAFEAAPDPIMILGSDGALVHANSAAIHAFGGHAPKIDGKAEATAADGRVFEFTASGMRLEGGAYGAILLGRNVTERRRAEELLRRNERLSALGTLVAGVAHEINNPLMYLAGHIEVALAENADANPDREAIREALETALRGAHRIEFIAKGLKTVVRSAPATHQIVRLNAVVEEVATLVLGCLPEDLDLRVELDPRDPVVLGDPRELHQVALNLTQNALEAMAGRRGVATLRTTSDDGHAEIVIADEGPGIAPQARGNLFTPFFTTKPHGTGLGLSIVHSLVKAHKGEIIVESEPGQGATFRVRVPRAVALVER